MKILIDMNLSPHWAPFLREAGHDATHWSAIGPGDTADTEVMGWAVSNGFVILTADLDFGAILAASKGNGPSVIQLRSDVLTPHAIGPLVILALSQAEPELLEGALMSLDAARARLRILPLE